MAVNLNNALKGISQSKKAMFFTMISIVLVLAIIAFFLPDSDSYSYMSKVPTLKTRFVRANSFASGLYGDVGERMIYHSGFQAIYSLIDIVNVTDRPIDDVSRDFKSVVMNGTIQGTDLSAWGINRMKNNTLPEKIAIIERMGREELNLDTNITLNDVYVYQSESTGPDKLAVEMNISMQLDSGMARWDTTKSVTAMIPLSRLQDPMIMMRFPGPAPIRFSNISNWTTVEEVYTFLNRTEYTYDPQAPSFLMRLANNSGNSSCCGMESLINPIRYGLVDNYNLTYVDYCFITHAEKAACGWPNFMLHNFTNISSPIPGHKFYGFKLEPYHITKYNITSIIDR